MNSQERLAELNKVKLSMGLVDACRFENCLIGVLSGSATDAAWDQAIRVSKDYIETSRKFTIDDAREMGGYDNDTQRWSRSGNDFPVAKPTQDEGVPF